MDEGEEQDIFQGMSVFLFHFFNWERSKNNARMTGAMSV